MQSSLKRSTRFEFSFKKCGEIENELLERRARRYLTHSNEQRVHVSLFSFIKELCNKYKSFIIYNQVLEGDKINHKAWKLVTVYENRHLGWAPEFCQKFLRSSICSVIISIVTLTNAVVTSCIRLVKRIFILLLIKF